MSSDNPPAWKDDDYQFSMKQKAFLRYSQVWVLIYLGGGKPWNARARKLWRLIIRVS
jgi:hypothetical protein